MNYAELLKRLEAIRRDAKKPVLARTATLVYRRGIDALLADLKRVEVLGEVDELAMRQADGDWALRRALAPPKVLAEGAGAVWADGTGWTVFTANVSNYLADKYHDFVPVTIIARKQG